MRPNVAPNVIEQAIRLSRPALIDMACPSAGLQFRGVLGIDGEIAAAADQLERQIASIAIADRVQQIAD
ncbi:MAG: hypothetical protein JWM53_1883 [bacterium]|nr:hypothetical protein [bacterium]